jgi:hypothetical protein
MENATTLLSTLAAKANQLVDRSREYPLLAYVPIERTQEIGFSVLPLLAPLEQKIQ